MTTKQFRDKMFTAMNHLVQVKEVFAKLYDELKNEYPSWEYGDVIDHLQEDIMQYVSTALNNTHYEWRIVREMIEKDPKVAKHDAIYGKEVDPMSDPRE